MNEGQLVARFRELFSTRIGDDAAVVPVEKGEQVLTSDMLVEDVDFRRTTPLHFVARKSLAVNLSDIAAMGARPELALLSLALPPWAREHLDDMLESFAAAAREHRIEIVGGDLSRGEKLVVSIAAIGRVVTRPLLRSGAKRGDRIYLSRPIGGAATGLTLLEKGVASYAEREFVESAIRRQLDPEPELALGLALAEIKEVTSCIDVSDGLSTDLHHLCEASGCGAEIAKERIPIFQDLLTFGGRLGVNVRDAVLHGGEEYALLFTSSLPESQLSARLRRPVYAIGRMTSERGVILQEEGIARPLLPGGFDHFAE
ncbi:MAG TPA: thiamine-phosphate kinase [Thermoanaerobaculia bacterium]